MSIYSLTSLELTVALLIPEMFSMIVGSSERNQNRKSALRFLLIIFFMTAKWELK